MQIHLVSKQDMRGRVFSSLEVVMHLGFLIAMFISAYASDKLKIPNVKILTTVGIVFAFAGIVGLVKYRKSLSANERQVD